MTMQHEEKERRVEAAYEKLAEACRVFGHTVDVHRPNPNSFPDGFQIDGTAFDVDISAERSCDRWECHYTGRLRISYKRDGRTRSRPEAKSGFPYDVLAAEVCEASAQKATHDKAEADRRARYDEAQKIADSINAECGANETTGELYLLAGCRTWVGPHASSMYDGRLAVVLDYEVQPRFECTPEEARELLKVALRIYAAHQPAKS